MANKLDDKPSETDNPTQKHYDDKFKELTSPEHLKKSGKSKGDSKTVDLNSAEKKAAGYYSPAQAGKGGAFGKILNKKISRRNKAVMGGTTGIIVALSVFIFSMLATAPFQFIQLSQLLGQNFASQELMSSRRTGAWMRKYQWGGKNAYVGSRLGVIGNRISNKIETRLSNQGIELVTSTDTGVLQGLRVNGDLVAEFDGSDGNKARRDFTKAKISEATGWNKSTTALMTRLPFRRYDINLRPFGNVIRNADESIEKFQDRVRDEKERRTTDTSFDYEAKQRRIQELEAETNPTQEQIDELDELRSDSGDYDRLSQEAREAYDSTEGDHNTKLKAAATKFEAAASTAGGASVVAMILALSCLVDNLADKGKTQSFENIYLPSNRMAADGLASGDQIKDGLTVDDTELGVHAESLHDDLSDTSWSDSEAFGGNVPIPNEFKVGVQAISTVETALRNVESAADLSGVGLLTESSFVCGVVTNPWTGWGLFVVEVGATLISLGIGGGILGGIKVAGTALVKELVGDFVAGKAISSGSNWILSALIGKVVPPLARGALYGSIVATGSHYAANEASRASGGISLDSEQSGALDSHLRDLRIEEDKKRGFAYRYLDLGNPHSLASSTYQSTTGNSVKDVMRGFAGLLSAPFRIAGNLLSGKVFAQTDNLANYENTLGSKKISFSLDEIFPDDPVLQDPFLAEQYVLDNNLRAKYIGCLKSPVESYREGRVDELEGYWLSPMPNLSPEECDYPDTPQEEYDYSVFRVAYFDELNLLSLACLEGDEVSCNELGVNDGTTSLAASIPGSTAIVGNPYESSVDVECAAGTRDLGIHSGYVKGEETQMRLCALTGFNSTRGSTSESNPSSTYYVEGANGDGIVNSRVSGAWFSLIQAAKADGVDLSATQSFRTMEHQEAFWTNNPDPSIVAPPGYSSHQAGVAIDFYGMNVKGGSTCDARATHSGDEWNWLFNNAERFGFKQYSKEAWHWDALNSANRCGGSGVTT